MMAAKKHGRQPAQRLGLAAHAYHKQKVAAPDPGPCKQCLLGKPNERLGVRVGTRNVGSMSGRGTEVCEEDGCALPARSEVERSRSAVYGCEG